jgi:hypothetical protein
MRTGPFRKNRNIMQGAILADVDDLNYYNQC